MGCMLGIVFVGITSSSAYASSVQSTETEGTIRFTGRYEPEGTPDPPPADIAKPPAVDRLPQTNTVHHVQWVWIGWLFVGLVAILGVKRNKKNKIN